LNRMPIEMPNLAFAARYVVFIELVWSNSAALTNRDW
jgi:hypothetical protein